MRTLTTLVVAIGCAPATSTMFTNGGEDQPAQPGVTQRYTFDDAAQGTLPAAFISVLGDWRVEQGELHQRGTFAGPDFPRVVLSHLTFVDPDVKVRCYPESGEIDQACGLMFRFVDSDNYLLTRANALEDNVRLYRVVGGDRQTIASADLDVTGRAWHTLEVSAVGDAITVSWDATQVLSGTDATFPGGKVGLWTKADSITRFDELEAVELAE